MQFFSSQSIALYEDVKWAVNTDASANFHWKILAFKEGEFVFFLSLLLFTTPYLSFLPLDIELFVISFFFYLV